MTHIICGVDVSSRFLDVCIGRAGAEGRFAQDAEGLKSFVEFCQAHDVTLVALEATGAYERPAFDALWAAGVPAAIVNPRPVRQFAKAMGRLEKTDAIDAGIIAWYAEVKGITPQAPPSQDHAKLKALVGRIGQLTQVKASQTLQKSRTTDPGVLALIEELLALLKRQIKALAKDVAALVQADPLWCRLDAEFRSVKGVADRTISVLLAGFSEIGTLSNKAASKLAGVAPLANDSGDFAGQRSIRGGRTSVRNALYIAAGVAARYEPDFQEFRERLLAKGKPKQVVRIALVRKLLVRLNAKARDVRREMGIIA